MKEPGEVPQWKVQLSTDTLRPYRGAGGGRGDGTPVRTGGQQRLGDWVGSLEGTEPWSRGAAENPQGSLSPRSGELWPSDSA